MSNMTTSSMIIFYLLHVIRVCYWFLENGLSDTCILLVSRVNRSISPVFT